MSSVFEKNVERPQRIKEGNETEWTPGLDSFNNDPENVQILLAVYLYLKKKLAFQTAVNENNKQDVKMKHMYSLKACIN